MKKKKRLFAILLALCVAFTMMPPAGSGCVAHAEDGTAANAVVTRTTMLDLTSTAGKYMTTNGTEKTVNFTKESVTDSAEGWSWNHKTKTLTLAGARIVVTKPTYIPTPIEYFKNGYYYGVRLPEADVTVVLTAGTENIIQAGDVAGETPEGTVIVSAGMGDVHNNKNLLTICGSGKLTVKGGKPANGGNTSARTSAGIYFQNVIVKGSAMLETCGDRAESTSGPAYSWGVACSQMTITDNAQVTATGGNVSAVMLRDSTGIRVSQSLSVSGSARLEARGATVETGENASSTVYSDSMGISAPDFTASENASVYAYGGMAKGQAGSSAGVYIEKSSGTAEISGNAFLHAEGSESDRSSYGVKGSLDGTATAQLTIAGNAYIEAIGKDIGDNEHYECRGISIKKIQINGGTVVARAEADPTKTKGHIEAIVSMPTYAEGLTPVVKAGTTETDAVKIESLDEKTYANRWVKIQTSEPKYAIAATPSEIDFGTAKAGYTQPDAKTVSITNTGNESILLDRVLQENDSKYNVSSIPIGQAIAPNETVAIFTVQPNAGLEPGEYNEKLTIKTGKGSQKAEAEVTLKFTVTRNSSSGGGGGYVPVQKPTILAGEGFWTTLSADGTKLTITPADGYEIKDVLLNGTSKGSVTELSGLKTGDKVEIKAEKKADPTDPSNPADPANPSADKNTKLIKGVENSTITLKSKLTKNKKILLTWTKSKGYRVDRFEIYRSVKKNSGYGKKAFFATKNGDVSKYLNTKSLKAGKTYYYKLRGVRTIDGKKYYTQWSNKAWRTVK